MLKQLIISSLVMQGASVMAADANDKGALNQWNLPAVVEVPASVKSQVKYQEVSGKLPIRNTQYMIRVPENWNGILLNDLDYCRRADAYLNMKLLEKGFALSGTGRRSDRGKKYDPAHEAHDFISLFDLFEQRFEKPTYIIQLGCSGGGTVTLTMVEKYADRVDGGIAACGATSPWMANMHLDALIVMQTLIAPDLQIINLKDLDNAGLAALGEQWTEAIDQAQQTPEGRARIALAITVGQWPAWGGRGEVPVPKPDPTDVKALQESMYHSLSVLLPNTRTRGTTMLERAGNGQLRSNVGVDYVEFFENGNADYQRAVEALYAEAGLSLADDLKRVNDAPRIEADPAALKYWSAPGRTHVGEPKVPLLRIHTSGDGLVYPALTQGYEDLVKQNGYEEFFRSAYVDNWGHCMFSTAEWMTAIDIMVERLETGVWPETDPESMNQRAHVLEPDAKARFFEYPGVEKFNRTWVPSIKNYRGVSED